MSQSINLANAYGIKKNGVDVHNVLLNGTKIWTAEYTLTTEYVDDSIKLIHYKWGYGRNSAWILIANPTNWGEYTGPSVGGVPIAKFSRTLSLYNAIELVFDGDHRAGAPFKSLTIDGVVLIPSMYHGSAENSDNGAYMYYQAADPSNPPFAIERTVWMWNSSDPNVDPNFPNYVPYAGLTKTNAINLSHVIIYY